MTEQTFGQWVTDQRESRRLSKTECAKRAGISVQRWAQIEYDESRRKDQSPPQPTRVTVERVAKGLDVPLNDVLRAAGYLPKETSFALESGKVTGTTKGSEPTQEQIAAAMEVLDYLVKKANLKNDEEEKP